MQERHTRASANIVLIIMYATHLTFRVLQIISFLSTFMPTFSLISSARSNSTTDPSFYVVHFRSDSEENVVVILKNREFTSETMACIKNESVLNW